MSDDAVTTRSYGKVFNAIATTYDRNRPGYPTELIDHAIQVTRLQPGDQVLEIGCGTGQLTRDLLANGLCVTAIEPGDQLAQIAKTNLQSTGELQIINAKLEDAELPAGRYKAVFCASAIHWVDPDVGWRLIAEALRPDGTLALIQYIGLDERDTADDQRDHLATMQRIAPELAAKWPSYRALDATLAGAQERQGNVSELWGWLGSYDLGREYVAALYDTAELTALPVVNQHTAEELTGLLRTMSFWPRLSPEQQQAIADENELLEQRLGRPLTSNTAACLVTARRTQ